MALTNRKPKWYSRFASIIEECWHHHGPSMHLNIVTFYNSDTEEWLILAAPVFQEVLGGEDDGKTQWTGFIFNSDAFIAADGVFIQHFAAASYCVECSPSPKIMFKGKYRGHKFHLQILLEPPKDSPVVEVLDTINKQVLCKEGYEDDEDSGDGSDKDQGSHEDKKPGEGHSPGLSGETPAN